MQLQQLTYIVEVMKTGSISETAKNLYVTPAGISKSITNLETELGLQIFQRSKGQGVVTTEEGKAIIKRAYDILKMVEELEEEARSFSTKISGHIKISTIPGFVPLMIKPLADFKKNYPDIKVDVVEMKTIETIESMDESTIDFGLISVYGDTLNKIEDLECEELLNGRMSALVNKNSILGLDQQVTPEKLLHEPLAIYNGDYSEWFVSRMSSDYKEMEVIFRSNYFKGTLEAVLEDVAISIAPNFCMESDHQIINGEMKMVEIVDYEPARVSLGLVKSKKKNLTKSAITFIEYFKQAIRKNKFLKKYSND